MENRSVDTYRCYLCAFLSPCSSTLMISGSRWAGSLGLSRYSKTFLPYLLLMTSSRDDRISWTGGNQARPEFNTVTSTFHTSSKWWSSPDIFTFLIPHHTHFYFLSLTEYFWTTWHQTHWEHGLFDQLGVVHTVEHGQKNQVTKLPL